MSSYAFIKCIAEPTRLEILRFLKDKEKCVCEIVEASGKEQSLISHHLQALKACGLVKDRQEGKKVFYKIKEPLINKLLDLFDEIAEKNLCKG
jgi:ArsR family transcriptional regulator